MTPAKAVGLPTVTPPAVSCEGCGACCTTVGSPPFFATHPAINAALGQGPPYWEAEYHPDQDRVRSLPPEADAEYVAYLMAAVVRRDGSDRANRPCLWLDPDTRRCRFYDHRPEVCRDFEVGGGGCLTYRKRTGVTPS